MKIREIRAVELPAPPGWDARLARRKSWLEVDIVASPMSRYPRFAYRRDWYPAWPDIGCLVLAEDGSWGLGTGLYGRPVAALINDYLGPRLAGEDAFAIEKCYDMSVRMCAPFGATGLAAYAVSAIDLALWDLKGRALDLPVYELLGGPAHDDMFCYATGNDTHWYMELGFKATKLVCPYGPADGLEGLRKNVEFVAKRRELVGDEIELMLDCWMAFDGEYTIRLAEALRPYRLKWMEEFLPVEDFDAHAEVRRRLPWQTLSTGEHWGTTYPFQYAATHRLVDILQPDIPAIGGITPVTKVAAIGEAAGLNVILHSGANSPYGQHASLALPAVPWIEMFMATPPGVPLKKAVRLPGTAVPENGRVRPPDRPGFGIDLSLEDLKPLAT